MFRKHLLIGAAATLACAGLSRADVSVSDLTVQPGTNVILMDQPMIGQNPTTAAEKPGIPATEMATTMPMMPATAPTATATTAPTGPSLPVNTYLGNIPHYSDLGITITGFVEGSWTYSTTPPPGNVLFDRSFDTKTESLQFDAVDLSVSKTPSYGNKAFDFGFTVEGMYGWDSAYIHSNGLEFVSAGKQADASVPAAGGTTTIHPKTQVDLVQANITLMLPLGHGIGIEGGKFDTLVGYEVIDAPANALFSHSYIFDEEPFTHTGLLGIYNLFDPADTTQSLTLTGGFSRGWDQATKDNNGSLDIMGQVKYVVTNKFSTVLSVISGDETPSGDQGAHPQNDGWRTLVDLNGNYTVSDTITLGYNGMYAWEAQDKNNIIFANGAAYQGPGIGQWYGVAAYGQWKPNEFINVNLRAEWFDDVNGSAVTQLADPTTGNSGIPNTFYEATLGVTVHPLADDPNFNGLAIRPEARVDYADHAAFNGGAHHYQVTLAAEAYFAF